MVDQIKGLTTTCRCVKKRLLIGFYWGSGLGGIHEVEGIKSFAFGLLHGVAKGM
jgi:hypothetical protein